LDTESHSGLTSGETEFRFLGFNNNFIIKFSNSAQKLFTNILWLLLLFCFLRLLFSIYLFCLHVVSLPLIFMFLFLNAYCLISSLRLRLNAFFPRLLFWKLCPQSLHSILLIILFHFVELFICLRLIFVLRYLYLSLIKI
jgi:hypothetical protein